MRKLAFIGGVVVLLFICGTVAMDYGDSVAVGTYSLAQNGETSTLVLKPDHTFQQKLNQSGKLELTEGNWHRFGEGGIEFSQQFVVLSGQERSAHGQAYAEMHKTLGLFVSLVLRDYYVLWYLRVDPSTDNTVTGTYANDEGGVHQTLTVKPDHTFEQAITHEGLEKHTKGSWSFSQSGDISFSKEFLKTSGVSLRDDETASAWNPSGSNLQIQIAASSKSGSPPIYHKKQLPW
jgi:hypothetical protein